VKVAGKPSPKLRAIYREAAAKHPDPEIRALVKPEKESLFTCEVCHRGNFTKQGLRAHRCGPKALKPGAASAEPGAPNEHGVLAPTETVVIPGLPRGCKAEIRLSEHEGAWHVGYDFCSPKEGQSAPCKAGVRRWATRDTALDCGFRWARGFFGKAGIKDAVRIIALRLDDEAPGSPLPAAVGPGMFTGTLADPENAAHQISIGRLDPKKLASAMNATPFPAARAARHTTPANTSSTMSKPLHKRPVQLRALDTLTIHPAIADDPRLAPKDPRYLAMQAAWDEQGGCPAIYATADGQIVDGRHRFWWLQKTEADEAPVIEVTEDEVPIAILGALAGRNHTTKGQRAYLAAPKLKAAFEAANARRIAILSSGGKAKLPVIPSTDDLAERLGFGRELLNQARRLHELFADGKEGKALRKEWEPKILDGEEPLGLGAALQGIGGQRSTKGAPKKPARNSALRNFIVGWKNLSKPASAWDKWDDETRELAVDGLRDAVAKLPEPVLEAVVAAVRVARKERAKAAEAMTSDQ
jgi:hypothetical protein